jgi:hypothetical protein
MTTEKELQHIWLAIVVFGTVLGILITLNGAAICYRLDIIIERLPR